MTNKLVPPLFLGIDGGGTKSKAALVDADLNLLGVGLSGPANPYQNLQQSYSSITEASKAALHQAGLPSEKLADIPAVVGLAGVNSPTVKTTVESWQHPFQQLQITTDLEIAVYGAHFAKTGAIIIAGTGSSGVVCVQGRSHIFGGHGFPQGDIASGAWIGRNLIEKVLLQIDGFGEDTLMTAALLKRIQGTTTADIVTKLEGASSATFAQFAPLAFEAAAQGDKQANKLLNSAAEYLSKLALKLWSFNPGRLSLIGGVSQQLKPKLDNSVRSLISEPKAQPEIGAAWLARHIWLDGNNKRGS